MNRGDAIVWLHQPRGGYGHTFPIPARFVRWAENGKVKVEVVKADGEIVNRTILDRNLQTYDRSARLSDKRRQDEAATA